MERPKWPGDMQGWREEGQCMEGWEGEGRAREAYRVWPEWKRSALTHTRIQLPHTSQEVGEDATSSTMA